MLEQYHYSQRLLEDERSISGSLREQLSQLKSDCNDREWKLLEQIAYLNSCSLKREEGWQQRHNGQTLLIVKFTQPSNRSSICLPPKTKTILFNGYSRSSLLGYNQDWGGNQAVLLEAVGDPLANWLFTSSPLRAWTKNLKGGASMITPTQWAAASIIAAQLLFLLFCWHDLVEHVAI